MHDALIYLLLKAINEKSFVDKSIVFGQDWVEASVTQPKVIDSSLELVDNTFIKEQRVVSSAANLCGWIVQQPEVISKACNTFGKVCSRDDTYDILMWQLFSGCRDATFSPEAMTTFSEMVSDVAASKEVSQAFQNQMSFPFNIIFSEDSAAEH